MVISDTLKALNLFLRDRNKMVKFAIYGLPIALGGAAYCKYGTEDNFNGQEFNKKALVLLRGYKDGVALVGSPYRTGKPNLGENDVNYTTGLESSIYFDVIGPRRTCVVQAWSSRSKLGERWEVDKMDMECDETQWTFYINPNKKATIKPTVPVEQLQKQLEEVKKQQVTEVKDSEECGKEEKKENSTKDSTNKSECVYCK